MYIKTQRNTYSTEFKLAFILCLVPDKLMQGVPLRSQYNFKSYNFDKVYGFAYSKDCLDLAKEIIQSQTLLKLNKAILSVYKTTINLYNTFLPNFKALVKKSTSARIRVVDTIDKVKDILGLFKSCRLFRISTGTYFNWKDDRKCSNSIFSKCFKRYPSQLSKKEERTVRYILNDPKTKLWPIISSYYYGLRNNLISMKERTFYKYANKLGFKKKLPSSRHKKHDIGIRASKPNELWHSDLTIFRTLDNVKVFIYIIKDNFSRKILNFKASLKYSADLSLECLKEAYETHILQLDTTPDIKLLVDSGSEINNLKVDNYLNQDSISIQKIIAGQDISFSNSMIEAANKILKYNYLFKTEIPDYDSCVNYLDIYIPDYNNRFHCSLGGLTPNEAYQGIKLNHDIISQQKKTALEQRFIENRSYKCSTHDN